MSYSSDSFFEMAEFLFDRSEWDKRYSPFVRVRRAALLSTMILLAEKQGYIFEPPLAEEELTCLTK